MGILSAAVPAGAPDMDKWDNGTYPTWWYSVVDYRRKLYYFGWYGNLNAMYVNLNEIETQGWKHDRKIKYLYLRSKELKGDVTHAFTTTKPRDDLTVFEKLADSVNRPDYLATRDGRNDFLQIVASVSLGIGAGLMVSALYQNVKRRGACGQVCP